MCADDGACVYIRINFCRMLRSVLAAHGSNSSMCNQKRAFPAQSFLERDLLTLRADNFNRFLQTLQVFVHTNIRCEVGGHMCSTNPANDPAYFPHLAHLDFLYTRWQSFSRQNLKFRYSQDDRDLPLAPAGFKVSQFHDSADLPGSIRVCYNPYELKNHPPPPPPVIERERERAGADLGVCNPVF